MEASFGEPYLLSSYAQSSKSATDLPHVFASQGLVKSKTDGYLSIAAQGDGVHILDLSTQHALLSHSCGHSTTFSCPPLLKHAVHHSSSLYTIYAPIGASPEINSQTAQSTVWIWDEDVALPLSERAAQKRKSVQIPHHIARVASVDGLESVLLLSPEGALTVTDSDLTVKTTTPGPSQRSLKRSFAFSREHTLFAPSRTAPSDGAIVIFVEEEGKVIKLRICGVASDASVVLLGDVTAPVHPKALAAVSCDSSGFLTILTHQSIWHAFKLQSSNGTTIGLIPNNEPLHLASLSHSKSDDRHPEISLLSLGSSHVLLAGSMAGGNRDIALLVWDMQYSVLLASHVFPRPASFTKDTILHLELVPSTSTQAALIISPINQKEQARSSILGVPYTVPSVSSIANVMGRGANGAQWIVPPDPSQGDSTIDYEPGQKKLLNVMKEAAAGRRIKAATDAFFEWEKKDAARREVAVKKNQNYGMTIRTSYGYEFVQSIVKMWLPSQKQADPAYLPEVAQHLLQTNSINASMVSNSQLLGFFANRNDWTSVQLALHHTSDLTESDIASTLRAVVNCHISKQDAMQVDAANSSEIPALEEFLPFVVSYAYTPATLRVAIRQHLRDSREVLCLLEILQGWVHDDSADRDKPDVKKTLDFIRFLLDSSFLSLIQYPPAHLVLRQLSVALIPELELSRELERLRLPLEPFARAARDRATGKKANDGLTRKERKIREQAQNAVVIGLYRLEELSL